MTLPESSGINFMTHNDTRTSFRRKKKSKAAKTDHLDRQSTTQRLVGL